MINTPIHEWSPRKKMKIHEELPLPLILTGTMMLMMTKSSVLDMGNQIMGTRETSQFRLHICMICLLLIISVEVLSWPIRTSYKASSLRVCASSQSGLPEWIKNYIDTCWWWKWGWWELEEIRVGRIESRAGIWKGWWHDENVSACVLSHFSHRVWLCATLQTVARQSPLSMRFSRQENWSGLLCPPPGDLPNPGIKLTSLMSPALADRFFSTNTIWEAPKMYSDKDNFAAGCLFSGSKKMKMPVWKL